jgi:pimeloyl-ACP methyl ester carboxylesterase
MWTVAQWMVTDQARGTEPAAARCNTGGPEMKRIPMTLNSMLMLAAIGCSGTSSAPTQSANNPPPARNIVLVHGAFVDGSGWDAVYSILRKDGYRVTIVQHPTITLEGDVAATKRVIDAQPGPVILVGHSYGGVVITEAGNDSKVKGLVYVAAFAPDQGESVNSLHKEAPPGAPAPPILPPQDGFLVLDRAKFHAAFAADLDADAAAFRGDSQLPWGVAALAGAIQQPAWRVKPSWYMVTTEDRMIPPQTQRAMSKRAGSAVVEVRSSHAVHESHPAAVAALIQQAAHGAR